MVVTRDIKKIGLSGPIGSGKSTIAKMLSDRHQYSVFSFADAIRQDVSKQYGIPVKLLYDRETKENYRSLLIEHGEKKRLENPNYWVKQTFSKIRKSKATRIVVDDVRQPFEAKRLRSKGFIVVRFEVNPERTYEYLSIMRGLPDEKIQELLSSAPETNFSVMDSDFTIPVGKTDTETYLRLIRLLKDIGTSSYGGFLDGFK